MAGPDEVRDDLRLTALNARDEEPLRSFYRDVLAPAFPSDELAQFDRLAARLDSTEAPASVVLAQDQADTILGGIVGEYFPISRALLLTYLVVRPTNRNQGIGEKLLGEVVPTWIDRWQPLLGVGEVEDPRCFPGAGNSAIARLRLYRRFPQVRIGLSTYIQPRLRPDGVRVPHMLLLVFYVDPSIVLKAEANPTVDGHAVRRFLEEYYTVTEGMSGLRDPEVQRQLDAAAPEGGLTLLPLAGLLTS